MKNKAYDSLKSKLDLIEEKFENTDSIELEGEVYQFEDELTNYLQTCILEEIDLFESLQKRVNNIKKEYDFYDAEAELDMMFPDRHDEDFDEDSMSFDSVFGGD